MIIQWVFNVQIHYVKAIHWCDGNDFDIVLYQNDTLDCILAMLSQITHRYIFHLRHILLYPVQQVLAPAIEESVNNDAIACRLM